MHLDVMLERKVRTLLHGEATFLAAQPPDDLAGGLGHVVSGVGVAGGDEHGAGGQGVNRVDMEIVVVSSCCVVDVGLVGRHVVQAVPLEEDVASGDVHLLHDRIQGGAIFGAACGL